MASSTNDKKPCLKCGSKGWVFPCDGCHASFCVKHAADHRVELATQLDNIQQQYIQLQYIYNQHEKRQEHPLFSQIDVWEHDTIAKIQQVAQTARDELRQLLDESNNQMKTVLNQFNDQLHTGREADLYTEIDLDQWKEQLMNIRKQLETPGDIELIPDNDLPPIHLIKVKTTKENVFIKTPSFIQPTELCDDTDNIECCSDDELEKPQSTFLDSNDSFTEEVLKSNESSTIPKEEPESSPNSCEMLLNEPCFLLDPTKNNHLLLFQSSRTLPSHLTPILNQLTNLHLQILNQEEDCHHELKCSEQATIIIDIPAILPDEQNRLLDTISELDNIHYIYIRGTPSEDDDERDSFFRRYPKIKAMFDNEERLLVQWAVDTANEYKKTGDNYVEIGDKDTGRKCFEQGIELYKRLSVYLNEKRRVR